MGTIGPAAAAWEQRVVDRAQRTAASRSVERGRNLIRAAAEVLERAGGDDITVQDVADAAGQSLRTLYQYFESKDDLLVAVFEEAMRSYAVLLERAIAALDDPLDRLAGTMVAAVRMPGLRGSGFEHGMVRVRLALSETQPHLVGEAQASVVALVRSLVEEAAAAGRLAVEDTEGATFMLLALTASFITAQTIGNDSGVRGPDIGGIADFCLRGLGADLEPGWVERIEAQLLLPDAVGGR